MKPKISFFINRLRGWGGVERLVLGILNRLQSRPWDIDLVLCTNKGASLHLLPKTISLTDLHCRERLFHMTLAFRKYLKAAKPQLVLSFMWPQSLSLCLLSSSQFKLVLSEHTSLLDHTTGLKMWMIKKFFPRADYIVCPSFATTKVWSQILRLDRSNQICTIPNGIDIQMIQKLAQESVDGDTIQAKCKYIITVARLIPRKNIATLIRAVSQLVNIHPNLRLLILGEGPEKQGLETLAIDLNISSYVKFLGLQTNPYKYLARSHILCLPTRDETDGIVNKEALILGVPVVSSNIDCIREVVVDGECGYLVPPDSVDAFAEKLRVLLEDESLRVQFGQEGQKRASAFSMDIVAERFGRVIENLL